MKKNTLKTGLYAILTAGLFFALLPESAFAGLLQELKFPSQVGSVKEVYSNPGSDPERIIIQIQDAHCNYEAQKNMIQMLDQLVKERKLKLILVEGGSGDVGLSFLRAYSDKKTREEVAERYLKQGRISGEEYLDIVSDYQLDLYGVEDDDLYNANLKAFLESESARKAELEELARLLDVIGELKKNMFSPELNRLEGQKQAYEDKRVGLVDYCVFLKETAESKGLDPKSFEQVSAFCVSAKAEKEIDFNLAEQERNAFIKELARYLDEAGVKDLVQRTQDFKAGKTDAVTFYSLLKDTAEGKFNLYLAYPHLHSYIQYVISSKKVNAQDLLNEMNLLEEAVKNKLYADEDQKKLGEISDSLTILSKFFRLNLTPEEYELFRAKVESATQDMEPFLAQNCEKFGLTMPQLEGKITDNVRDFDEFYQLGADREKAFIRNITEKMDQSGEKIAVLITGGFHTPGVSKLLKESGFSYAVVTPVITEKGDDELYFSVLKGKSGLSEGTSEE